MIRVVLILSVVVMAVTAVFGVLNRSMFEGERGLKEEKNNELKVVKGQLNQAEDSLADTKAKLDDFKDQRDEESAKLSNSKADLERKKETVLKLSQSLDESRLKLKEFEVILKKFEGKSVEDIKDRLEGMEQEITDKKAELEKLEQERTIAENAVAANENAIEAHVQKQKDRSAGIARNAFEATIKAVNNDWGFVIIDAGKSRGVTADSPLLVSRDGERVARLNIVSVENDITVADIDQDSMARGARIQPGYTVVYERVSQ